MTSSIGIERLGYALKPSNRMNHFSSLVIRSPRNPSRFARSVTAVALSLLCFTACSAPASNGSVPPADPLTYRLTYDLRPAPDSGLVDVTLTLVQARDLLREMRFAKNPRVSHIEGDGELDVRGAAAVWRPPPGGGTLRWRVSVQHRRNGDGYDAWLGPDWGLFRAEDVIPRAATRTLKGAESETWLRMSLPGGWSAVTQYFDQDGGFRVDNPDRRFDQPNGWVVIGNLGVRRESIAATRVAVAGPVGQSIRRMDILALLNWTLPELARLLPELPQRLTIVSAGEPMWRGGLSAPQSLYMHSERPLISENATSTLLHEVLHISLNVTAKRGVDWIVEGLAEFYSLELLHRSGTITDLRYRQARSDLADWSRDATTLCRPISAGATTALAVTVFVALDEEIKAATENRADLDDLTRALWRYDGNIGLHELRTQAEAIAGRKLDTLHIDNLPGCRTISADPQAH